MGKTWIMKEFGQSYYQNMAYINFDGNTRMLQLFSGDFDISRIIAGIEIESGIKINPNDTLIVFDEIQENPNALTSLKYFYEKAPQYNIIAAGSMLGVALHENTSFPVGKVEFLNLFPLSFHEFLDACEEKKLLELIEKRDWPLVSTFRDRYINLLQSYYFIGGMPEALNDFITHKDYFRVKKIQKNILISYEQDFSKHVSTGMVTKVRMIWNSIIGQLSKENKKFIYGALKKGARAKEYESALTWLEDCGLIYRVNRVNVPMMPLKAYEDLESFKLFILDVGLLAAMGDINPKILLESPDIFSQFKGALTEQYVLQQLKTFGNIPINYWTNNNATSEVDFVIQIDNEVAPLEVKSSLNLKSKSLKVYMDKFSPAIVVRSSIADYKQIENLYDIPLYAIEQIKSINAKH